MEVNIPHDPRLRSLTLSSSSKEPKDRTTPRSRIAVSALRKKRPMSSTGPCSTVTSVVNEERWDSGTACEGVDLAVPGAASITSRLAADFTLTTCPLPASGWKELGAILVQVLTQYNANPSSAKEAGLT